jgi:hypothetical protein
VDDKVLSGADALTRQSEGEDGHFDFSWTNSEASKEHVRAMLQRVLATCGKDVFLPPNPVVFVEEHDVASKIESDVPAAEAAQAKPSVSSPDAEVGAYLAEFDFLDTELDNEAPAAAPQLLAVSHGSQVVNDDSDATFSASFVQSSPPLVVEAAGQSRKSSEPRITDGESLRSTSHVSIGSLDSNPQDAIVAVQDNLKLSVSSTSYFHIAQDSAEDCWEQLMASVAEGSSSQAVSHVFLSFTRLVTVCVVFLLLCFFNAEHRL